jgi:uncharacterized protein YndB with AHSA1/START domain
MATVTRHIHTSPHRLFEVLSEGWLYSNWVVGTSHITAVDPNWPHPGSVLYHSTGIWPVVTRDESIVEEFEPARRLVITAKGRPLGSARITLDVEPDGAGCRVTMCEIPTSGPGRWLHPLIEPMLAKRNGECLHRLAALAERHECPPDVAAESSS